MESQRHDWVTNTQQRQHQGTVLMPLFFSATFTHSTSWRSVIYIYIWCPYVHPIWMSLNSRLVYPMPLLTFHIKCLKRHLNKSPTGLLTSPPCYQIYSNFHLPHLSYWQFWALESSSSSFFLLSHTSSSLESLVDSTFKINSASE